MILRHEFAPLDNRRLAHLCGPTDAHLRSVESAFDVRITRRQARLSHRRGQGDVPKRRCAVLQ